MYVCVCKCVYHEFFMLDVTKDRLQLYWTAEFCYGAYLVTSRECCRCTEFVFWTQFVLNISRWTFHRLFYPFYKKYLPWSRAGLWVMLPYAVFWGNSKRVYFEVFLNVNMLRVVFWIMTPCSFVGSIGGWVVPVHALKALWEAEV